VRSLPDDVADRGKSPSKVGLGNPRRIVQAYDKFHPDPEREEERRERKEKRAA
jgi:hypothetical protein